MRNSQEVVQSEERIKDRNNKLNCFMVFCVFGDILLLFAPPGCPKPMWNRTKNATVKPSHDWGVLGKMG